MKTRYADLLAYVTKDGSEIRELMHPAVHGNRNQSLAEAIVRPGQRTLMHRHLQSEELYHVTAGEGVMALDGRTFSIACGDTILIPPDTPHCVQATGAQPLRILCCSSPPYTHEDTSLVDA